MENNRTVEGFSFYTDKDAALAAQEKKKIEYLEARMNYKNPESVLNIYNRAIQERIFKTPVGIIYLKQIQMFLQKQEKIEQDTILPIPLYTTFEAEIREQTNPAKKRIQAPPKKKTNALPISIILNVGLIFLVIAMFIITLNSSQPNILNYKNNLVNQYSAWEQELTEREQIIKEKELKLKME